MLSDPNKPDHEAALMQLLHSELQRIDTKRYSSEPQYVALFEGIQSITMLDTEYTQLSRELLTRLQELTLHISQKFKMIIDECIASIQHLRNQVEDAESLAQHERERADAAEEQQQLLAKHFGALEVEYQRLRGEKTEIQLRYEVELKRVKKEKKEIRRTFLQVREDTEEDRKLLENMHFQKNQIKERMEEEKRTKQTLLQEIEQMRRTVIDHQQKIVSSAAKLSYQQKRIAKLQEELIEKNLLIQTLLAKHQSSKPTQSNQIDPLELPLLGQLQSTESRPRTDRSNKRHSFANTYNLGEEMVSLDYEAVNLNEDYESPFVRQTSVSRRSSLRSLVGQQELKLNHSIVEEESSQSRVDCDSRRVMVPDLYFAHYLLTVQSVKLKLGREELFGIEMRDQYTRMIEEGVAFHLWDEWIAATLKEMGKNK